jgi:hypothetical protein
VSFDNKILMAETIGGVVILGLSDNKVAIFDLNSIVNFNG